MKTLRRSSAPWLPALGVGMLGVVIGHSVTYLLAVPALVRSNLLAATGHAYWSNAVSAGLLAGLAAAGGVVIRSFRAGRQGRRVGSLAYPGAVWRLALVQVLAFSILEICERALAGVPVASMFQDHIYPLGVGIQVLVAVIGAVGLVLLARVAQALGTRLARSHRRQRRLVVTAPPYAYRPWRSFSYDILAPRGPPLLLRLQP
ncbi:MAG TPA: hypothetical protein VHA57_00700 [Actinomycetota bacterium]|nr:hypothetical protein [Actinomycetota bacterium]